MKMCVNRAGPIAGKPVSLPQIQKSPPDLLRIGRALFLRLGFSQVGKGKTVIAEDIADPESLSS
jgi:hypothetical protein